MDPQLECWSTTDLEGFLGKPIVEALKRYIEKKIKNTHGSNIQFKDGGDIEIRFEKNRSSFYGNRIFSAIREPETLLNINRVKSRYIDLFNFLMNINDTWMSKKLNEDIKYNQKPEQDGIGTINHYHFYLQIQSYYKKAIENRTEEDFFSWVSRLNRTSRFSALFTR